MLTVETGVGHTESMTAYTARRVIALGDDDLCGYVRQIYMAPHPKELMLRNHV